MMPAAAIILTTIFIFTTWIVTRYYRNIKCFPKTFPILKCETKSDIQIKNDTRKHERVAVEGIRADISDGRYSYTGLITNISTLGLCLKDVPEKLSASKSLLSIVVRGKSEEYRIVARPRWEQAQTNRGKTIGAEIASSPHSWGDFVLSH